MFRKTMTAVLVAAGLGFGWAMPVARADDAKIDNPEYTAWAKFKADTTVTYNMKVDFGGMSQTASVTTKLVSVADDKVVVTTEGKVAGRTQAGKNRDVPAKVGADKKMGEPQKETEDVKVGDVTYKCKVYEIDGPPPTMTGPQAKMMEGAKTKVWSSDEVPGGMVKMTCETKKGEQTFSMAMTVSAVDKK